MTQSTFFASGYASPEQPGIFAFHFNEGSGEITSLGSFTGINAPSFLTVHSNRRWLYAVSETGQASHGALGQVWSFTFDPVSFVIQKINHQSTQGDWPCHLQLDSSGNWLVATNYGTGNAVIYPIQQDGSIGEMSDFVQQQGSGPNKERQEASHAHSSIFTPENRFLIVADLGTDELVIYRFESGKGKLIKHSSLHTRPGAGPRHLIFHPNGGWLYAANELDSSVTLYHYESSTGSLTEKQTIPTVPNGTAESIVADIHISKSAQRLLVSNRGHNSIAVFNIGPEGILTLVSIPSCGGNWPRNFALSPSEKFMLVANQYSNEVCVLSALENNDALGPTPYSVPITAASCVQFIKS